MIDLWQGLDQFIEQLTKQRRRTLTTLLITIVLLVAMSGCASLKEAGWVTGTALATGGAASLVAGPVPAVVAASTIGGITAAVVQDSSSVSAAQADSGYAVAAVTLKESIKWLGICGVIILIFGWLVPSPFKLNRREK
tara:strand:+ start:1100 stop:1513 length:414 start_codon:yes stop_codon:yes gene_type:complete